MTTRMVDISFVHSEALPNYHQELREHFEPMVVARSDEPEVQVMAGITLRTVRLAMSTMLLCKHGLVEESRLPLRSATESVVNLLYIMTVCPTVTGKSRRDLALQFAAYGDIAHHKMIAHRPDQARSAFMKQGMTQGDFDAFVIERKCLADDAQNLHGCTSTRWHSMSLHDMAQRVRKHAPSFVDRGIADQIFATFTGDNSATHADALSIRSQYAALENAPLELKFQQDNTFCEIASVEASWAWKVVGDFFGEFELVDRCISTHMRNIMKDRFEVSPLAP